MFWEGGAIFWSCDEWNISDESLVKERQYFIDNVDLRIAYGAGDINIGKYLYFLEVAILVNEKQPAVVHMLYFNGSSVASGMYLYRLMVNGRKVVKKMILRK